VSRPKTGEAIRAHRRDAGSAAGATAIHRIVCGQAARREDESVNFARANHEKCNRRSGSDENVPTAQNAPSGD